MEKPHPHHAVLLELGGCCRERSWTNFFSTGESAESGNRRQAGLTPVTSVSHS